MPTGKLCKEIHSKLILLIQHRRFTSCFCLTSFCNYYCSILFPCSVLKTWSLPLRNASVPAIWAVTDIRGPNLIFPCLSSTEARRVFPHFSPRCDGEKKKRPVVFCWIDQKSCYQSFCVLGYHKFSSRIFWRRKKRPPTYLGCRFPKMYCLAFNGRGKSGEKMAVLPLRGRSHGVFHKLLSS